MKHIKDIIPDTMNALIREHQPKAIDTFYANRLFRSRLEARWAVFFDALNIKWDYEKEGYELNGIRYLPDFWLPEVYLRTDQCKGLWVEIKPTVEAMKKDKHKFFILDEPLIVFVGNPPGTEDYLSGYEYRNEDNGGYVDNSMNIMECSTCGSFSIVYFTVCYCPLCETSNTNKEHEEAVTKAISARFE